MELEERSPGLGVSDLVRQLVGVPPQRDREAVLCERARVLGRGNDGCPARERVSDDRELAGMRRLARFDSFDPRRPHAGDDGFGSEVHDRVVPVLEDACARDIEPESRAERDGSLEGASSPLAKLELVRCVGVDAHRRVRRGDQPRVLAAHRLIA